MNKSRLEAFGDGVIAIIITIMVLELRIPHGAGRAALRPILPVFLAYLLGFVFLGIYWNNHHHLLQAATHVNGRILWAVALMWLVPDLRIERVLASRQARDPGSEEA